MFSGVDCARVSKCALSKRPGALVRVPVAGSSMTRFSGTFEPAALSGISTAPEAASNRFTSSRTICSRPLLPLICASARKVRTDCTRWVALRKRLGALLAARSISVTSSSAGSAAASERPAKNKMAKQWNIFIKQVPASALHPCATADCPVAWPKRRLTATAKWVYLARSIFPTQPWATIC